MGRHGVISALVFTIVLWAGAALAAGPEFGTEGTVWGDVYFAAESAELSGAAMKELDTLAAWTKGHPGAMVLLAGYDEQRTPEKESVALGWKRARAVSDYLVSKGADPGMVNSISFGNTKLAVTGDGEPVWSKNRRVRYRAVDMSGDGKDEEPSGVCQRCKR
ncbi:MAG: OmpA family protein [Nitrospirae bacterium]|nr:OmpA family protein [Nitrospirota bacterium]MBI5696731.1 OmpA family protein [Nitrospirota bacterium]